MGLLNEADESAPDMTLKARMTVARLPIGSTTEQIVAAVAGELRNAWVNGYTHGAGDVLADVTGRA